MPLNRVYGRPIFPLGQLWQAPPAGEIVRFRALAQATGSAGVSWWDWQEASLAGWNAIASPFASVAALDLGWPTLRLRARGDLVVWAQEHLRGAGFPALAADGVFGSATRAAVSSFQAARGLPVTGALDPVTWPRLLAAPVVAPDWTATGASAARAASVGQPVRAPRSARLPAVRNEIPPRVGAGAPAAQR
jgi:hypothetical protein